MNIDYEKIYEDMANDYIEFIRELSNECRKNNIVLSVDTYVSQTYNQFYNRKGISEVADYLFAESGDKVFYISKADILTAQEWKELE